MLLLKIFLLALAVEAITEIITKRSIFEPLRTWLEGKSKYLFELFSCGACMSVWVSVFLSYLFNIRGDFIPYENLLFIEPLIFGFIIHRLSNYWHQIYGSFKNGPVFNSNQMRTTHKIEEND